MLNTIVGRRYGWSQPRHRPRASIGLPPSSTLSDRLLWPLDETGESYLLTARIGRRSKREVSIGKNDIGHPRYRVSLRGLSKGAFIQEAS